MADKLIINGISYTLYRFYEAGTNTIETAYNYETGERSIYCAVDIPEEEITNRVAKAKMILDGDTIKKECPENFQHVKVERVLLSLFTDENDRRLVGGCDIDNGRDWVDVFNDCAREIVKTGRVVDVKVTEA